MSASAVAVHGGLARFVDQIHVPLVARGVGRQIGKVEGHLDNDTDILLTVPPAGWGLISTSFFFIG